MLIDTHAHLDAERFAPDRDEVVAQARAAGVQTIITCGTDLVSSRATTALCERYQDVYAAVGVHPHAASSLFSGQAISQETLDELIALASQSGAAAIGEIGLDYHYDLSPREAQRDALSAQLQLAVELDVPVVLHCREADDDLMAIVGNAPRSLRGVLHCFMGGDTLARWALDRGFYLGIAGPITFKRMNGLADVARLAPLNRLLVETDCPYLAPQPLRGRRNEPAYVVYVAERLAQIRALPLDALAAATSANARELFGVG